MSMKNRLIELAGIESITEDASFQLEKEIDKELSNFVKNAVLRKGQKVIEPEYIKDERAAAKWLIIILKHKYHL